LFKQTKTHQFASWIMWAQKACWWTSFTILYNEP